MTHQIERLGGQPAAAQPRRQAEAHATLGHRGGGGERLDDGLSWGTGALIIYRQARLDAAAEFVRPQPHFQELSRLSSEQYHAVGLIWCRTIYFD